MKQTHTHCQLGAGYLYAALVMAVGAVLHMTAVKRRILVVLGASSHWQQDSTAPPHTHTHMASYTSYTHKHAPHESDGIAAIL